MDKKEEEEDTQDKSALLDTHDKLLQALKETVRKAEEERMDLCRSLHQ